MLDVQVVPSVQTSPAQHGRSTVPHAPASAPLGAMHVPGPPDDKHEFGELQNSAPSPVSRQHGSLTSPQATQPLALQRLPVLHVSSLQQS